MNVFGLVQLCEATQPAGGYSYSLGVETMARTGRLRSADELLAFVQSILKAAIAPADGVASGIAFRAARRGDFQQIPDLCVVMSSGCMPVEMRLASLQMGQRLWAISRSWPWAEPIHAQLDGLAAQGDLHHAVAFGALVSETTSSQVRAIATYLFNTAKSIITAAVKAIPLDESTGQHLLSDVQPTIVELATAYADKNAGDIGVARSPE